MTDQTRVDWTLSYLARHVNDHRRPTTDAYQPSLYDVENDDDDQEENRGV